MVTLKINNGNCLLLAWNNGKEVLRLVLTSLTTPGLQIHYGWPHPNSKYTDQSAAAVLCLMSAPANGRHAFTDMCTTCLSDAIIMYLNYSFSLTQQLPICEPPSHSSMPPPLYPSHFSLIVEAHSAREIWVGVIFQRRQFCSVCSILFTFCYVSRAVIPYQ